MLLYGMTTGSLRFRLNKTEEEAEEITTKYWGTFPRIQPFLQEVMDNVRQYGRVRYWSGRIWREEEEDMFYKGCNAQIQGGAADIMSLAIMRAHHVLTYNSWGRVISIVHDEILTEVKTELVDTVLPILVRIMECEDIFGLPFRSEAKVGDTYGTLQGYELPNYVSTINWEEYANPNFDISKYKLTPWEAGKY